MSNVQCQIMVEKINFGKLKIKNCLEIGNY